MPEKENWAPFHTSKPVTRQGRKKKKKPQSKDEHKVPGGLKKATMV